MQGSGGYMSGKSLISFTTKFIRDFQNSLKEVIPNQRKTKMHYLELMELLKKMGFIKEELKYQIQAEKISNNQLSSNTSNAQSNEILIRYKLIN